MKKGKHYLRVPRTVITRADRFAKLHPEYKDGQAVIKQVFKDFLSLPWSEQRKTFA